MRKINTLDFRVANRTTSREVNRQIVLNLVREHQPISRAEIARRMRVGRGVISVLVQELLDEGVVYEGDKGEAPRGRKPQFLYVRTRDRMVVAVDVRLTQTRVLLSDFGGRQLALETLATQFSPEQMVEALGSRIQQLLRAHGADGVCEGIGMVVPGMVDRRTGRVLHAPQLGWRDVDVRDALAHRTGLPVHIENAPIACALSRMWRHPGEAGGGDNFAYVTISDGVGVGIVVNGEVVRGRGNTAGEFGHIPIALDGPPCRCGSRGCWEVYASNPATLDRFRREVHPARAAEITSMAELIAAARAGEPEARDAVLQAGRFVGIGTAMVINALNPSTIFVGGELTGAWELVEAPLLQAIRERSLTDRAARTPVIPDDHPHPRLRGAAALLVAPDFAAPRVA